MAQRKQRKLTAAEMAAAESDSQPEAAAAAPPAPLPPPEPPPAKRGKVRGKQADDGKSRYSPRARGGGDNCCLVTWVGPVDGKHRHVRRGTAAADIPQAVIDRMLESGGAFGTVGPGPAPEPRKGSPVRVENLGRG